MKHNILSVSQMCDQGHKVTFDSQKCEIRKEGSGKLVATTARTSSNIYVLSEIGNEKCCVICHNFFITDPNSVRPNVLVRV